jgi:hypothetical protein
VPTVTVEGKPQLFFSDNALDKAWRLKEKIVAIVESYFQGMDDLYAFSSIRIPNIVGDATEVDIVYSSIPDPTEAFEFVQVRDRADTQGRPWLEQIIGQQRSLGINRATMVSTEPFSKEAVRLAKHQNIHLRILLPETEENMKQWYAPDFIGIHKPLVQIAKASILASIGEKTYEFKAEGKTSMENNILVPTGQPHRYEVISLSRVFEVDIMQDLKRHDDLMGRIPEGSGFHRATVAIEYQQPRLFLKVAGLHEPEAGQAGGIYPIGAIVFFVNASRQSAEYPISYRYKYVNALSDEIMAQVIVSEAEVDRQRYYICLVRHSLGEESYQVGGAFFR